MSPANLPRLNNTPAVDYVTAVSLTQGILAALVERQRSGRGQMVSTSLFDVALAMQTLEISSQEIYGYRTSWLRQAMIYRDARRLADRADAVPGQSPAKSSASAFEIEDLSQNPKFATTDLQIQHLREIEKMFVPVFARFNSADCMARLAKVDILCAPVNDVADIMDHPQTIHNGTIWDIPIPGQKAARLAGNPVRLSRTPPKVYRQPTALARTATAFSLPSDFHRNEIQALRSASIVR